MPISDSLTRRRLGAITTGALFAYPCLAKENANVAPAVDVAVAWLADGDPITAPGRAARLIDDIANTGPHPEMIVLMAREPARGSLQVQSEALTAQAKGWGIEFRILESPADMPARHHDLVTLQHIPQSTLG
ncbi:MAG: hypothetical protein KDE14_09855 [Rhodobacteraceae bacterium]|nr:hypothetical protein [Paracoccaceae bacterium]